MTESCQGRTNHCSWDCCSKPYMGLSLNDVLSLVPERIDESLAGIELTERMDYHRVEFFLKKGKGTCRFLRRIDETPFFECGLEHEGFGLDVCKVWPAGLIPNSEGEFEIGGKRFTPTILDSCPSYNLASAGELVSRNMALLERRFEQNKSFTNHLNGRSLDSEMLIREIFDWRDKKVEGEDSFFSLELSGKFYPKASFV